METRTVKVPNVGCNGCVNTIKSEVGELDGCSTSPEIRTPDVYYRVGESGELVSYQEQNGGN